MNVCVSEARVLYEIRASPGPQSISQLPAGNMGGLKASGERGLKFSHFPLRDDIGVVCFCFSRTQLYSQAVRFHEFRQIWGQVKWKIMEFNL